MEDRKNLNQHEDIPDKNINKEAIGMNNKKPESISTKNDELIKNKVLKVNLTEKSIDTLDDQTDGEKILEDNKKTEITPKLKNNIDKSNNIEKSNTKSNEENKFEEQNKAILDSNSDTNILNSTENIIKVNKELAKKEKSEENKKLNLNIKSNSSVDKKIKIDPKAISNSTPEKAKTKPVKEPPIEKKPFLEFVNDYLIPEIKNEFKLKGKEVNKINLQKTNRPIADDICWVIYCEISDTCNFWLSFEKDDITSLKSFSLCKNYEKPSIIESFLIDEKKITLKLIISRILQRLNGQKLIGAN